MPEVTTPEINVIRPTFGVDTSHRPHNGLDGKVIPFPGDRRLSKDGSDAQRILESPGFAWAMNRWYESYRNLKIDTAYNNQLDEIMSNLENPDRQVEINQAKFALDNYLIPIAGSDGSFVDFHLLKMNAAMSTVDGSLVYVGSQETGPDGETHYEPGIGFDQEMLIATAVAWTELAKAGCQVNIYE